MYSLHSCASPAVSSSTLTMLRSASASPRPSASSSDSKDDFFSSLKNADDAVDAVDAADGSNDNDDVVGRAVKRDVGGGGPDEVNGRDVANDDVAPNNGMDDDVRVAPANDDRPLPNVLLLDDDALDNGRAGNRYCVQATIKSVSIKQLMIGEGYALLS